MTGKVLLPWQVTYIIAWNDHRNLTMVVIVFIHFPYIHSMHFLSLTVPKFGFLKLLIFNYGTKKDVGTILKLVPQIEALALPCRIELASIDPTMIWIQSSLALQKRWMYNHTMRASTLAMFKILQKFARFRFVSNKRQSKRLFICRDPLFGAAIPLAGWPWCSKSRVQR